MGLQLFDLRQMPLQVQGEKQQPLITIEHSEKRVGHGMPARLDGWIPKPVQAALPGVIELRKKRSRVVDSSLRGDGVRRRDLARAVRHPFEDARIPFGTRFRRWRGRGKPLHRSGLNNVDMLHDQQGRPAFTLAKCPLRGTESIYKAVQTRMGFG